MHALQLWMVERGFPFNFSTVKLQIRTQLSAYQERERLLQQTAKPAAARAA